LELFIKELDANQPIFLTNYEKNKSSNSLKWNYLNKLINKYMKVPCIIQLLYLNKEVHQLIYPCLTRIILFDYRLFSLFIFIFIHKNYHF